MPKIKLGLAICGSYCTFDKIMPIAESLTKTYGLTAVMSESAAETDTRFGCAETMRKRLEGITGGEIIRSITAAEPIGPKKLFDVLAVAPCTGNTLAKLACGITDSAVTMAGKAHLRNGRPLVIAISTNDALAANAKNIGELLNRKNVYFVPFRQDDPRGKPASIVADLSLLGDTVEAALAGRQLQPLMLGPQ
ncbi:MAG: dipicolinate synthase subunit B [Oscillospiraceae bacterium]|jgi:dipicolinate synthase subunit B|nr:dipicolinate synthase subunit B [Oscillospiraceae bacterium]